MNNSDWSLKNCALHKSIVKWNALPDLTSMNVKITALHSFLFLDAIDISDPGVSLQCFWKLLHLGCFCGTWTSYSGSSLAREGWGEMRCLGFFVVVQLCLWRIWKTACDGKCEESHSWLFSLVTLSNWQQQSAKIVTLSVYYELHFIRFDVQLASIYWIVPGCILDLQQTYLDTFVSNLVPVHYFLLNINYLLSVVSIHDLL